MLGIALSVAGTIACVGFILFCIGVVIQASVKPRVAAGREIDRRDLPRGRCCKR